MDLPKPPDDPDLKNIIDKLANFVARNGPDFENMTKQKQKDNPKFGFLFGGPNFNYYTFRVNTEQAIMKNQLKQQQQQQQQQQPPPQQAYQPPWQPPPYQPPVQQPPQVVQPLAPNPAAAQIQQMQEQIQQSEQNLAAQYTTMMQQQQVQVDEHLRSMREEKMRRLCETLSINREELDAAVQPIIEACTKDAISNGKNWMFNHSQTPSHCELIGHYLINRVCAPDASFTLRLHLIYLINDVLHHCTRKNVEDLRQAIENVVVGIFSTAHHTPGVEPNQQQKLEKLLDLWSKNAYFQPAVLEALKDPTSALRAFQKTSEDESGAFISGIKAATQQQYQGLQKQHLEFVNHMNGQIQALQYQHQQQQQQAPPTQPMFGGPPSTQPPPAFNPNAPPPSFIPGQPPPNVTPSSGGGRTRPSRFNQPPPGMRARRPPFDGEFQPQPQQAPDFDPSRPPPFGQNPNQMPPLIPPQPEPDLTPNVPYYELPAGLMAPLVKLEDHDYEPLDPKVMRLPPPMPPSERLLAAVEAFYAQPSHERPRDSEGWEKLGLFEFYRAKQKAKRQKEENGQVTRRTRMEIKRERSRSPSKSPEKPKRRRKFDAERERLQSSRSRSPIRRSRSASQSQSRSGSSERKEKSTSRSRSRSRSRSPKRRRSVSPRRSRSKSASRSRSRSRSRSPKRKSRSRSVTPPRTHRRRSRSKSRSATPEFTSRGLRSSARFPVTAPVSLHTKIGEDNKGHMLMKKMGWGGGGLGQDEQGIVEPIKAGEVRDRSDQFKGIGVGVADDPFEQFRKNQSQGFINRMKARTEEKPNSKSASSAKRRQRRDVPID